MKGSRAGRRWDQTKAMGREVTDNQSKEPGFKQDNERDQIHAFLGSLCCVVEDGPEQETRGRGPIEELGQGDQTGTGARGPNRN